MTPRLPLDGRGNGRKMLRQAQDYELLITLRRDEPEGKRDVAAMPAGWALQARCRPPVQIGHGNGSAASEAFSASWLRHTTQSAVITRSASIGQISL